MRLGILGGTFDPIHIGHLILAEEAWYQLGLDQVLLAPAADPPHKRDQGKSPAEHRVRMVELAIADNPHLALSRVDVDRPGPHYTLDMVRCCCEQYGAGRRALLPDGPGLAGRPAHLAQAAGVDAAVQSGGASAGPTLASTGMRWRRRCPACASA